MTRYLRLKDTHSNLGATFSREDGDNSMDMESVLHGSENDTEDENQLNLPETIDSLTTGSNLQKKFKKQKKWKNILEKSMRFWKHLENR